MGSPIGAVYRALKWPPTATSDDLHRWAFRDMRDALIWAAAFLEGEGSFTVNNGTLRVTANQVQREPLERLRAIFGGKVSLTIPSRRRFIKSEQPLSMWNLNGPQAIGLAMSVYKTMSPRRKAQIIAAMAPWKAAPPSPRYRNFCRLGHPYDEVVILPTGQPHRRCSVCRRAWSLNDRANNRERYRGYERVREQRRRDKQLRATAMAHAS